MIYEIRFMKTLSLNYLALSVGSIFSFLSNNETTLNFSIHLKIKKLKKIVELFVKISRQLYRNLISSLSSTKSYYYIRLQALSRA